METTVVYRCTIGIMENKVEPTILGLGGLGVQVG